MRVPFADRFYTKDFDQEMLDYVKDKYIFWENEDYPFTVNEDTTVLRYDSECFIVTWVKEGNELTKEQFKERIGMPNTASNTVTKDMLKTGMIIKHHDAYGGTSLAMVLLNTADGDIFAGKTWGVLDNNLAHIIEVYQPRANKYYLNGGDGYDEGINLDGCTLIWERKSPEQLEIDKLQSEVDERLKRINELKESM
ncbi:hypothetical protein [Pseudoalteromonas phage PH357]|nr:hypothetical protein [Pseudoalteromonas phage PH357]